jgi:succinate-semialdehyde dehydrogenase/glutarate-semialdehyde dehydrogenase
MPSSESREVRRIYLDGRWIETGESVPVVNPSTGNTIARVATVSRERVAEAIATAADSWASWRQVPGRERGVYLSNIADVIQRRSDEFARAITLENGKPLAQSRGEVAMTVDHFRWFAGEASRIYGRVVPQQVPGKRHLVIRSPIGVVGAIAPWNFPLVLAVRKVAPALASGCPVVLKPATATPLSAIMLAEAIDEAGLPPGVFQLVIGKASEIGAEMLENPLCRKITFTGSTEVGKQQIRGAAGDVTK